jgi:hypothetical protein
MTVAGVEERFVGVPGGRGGEVRGEVAVLDLDLAQDLGDALRRVGLRPSLQGVPVEGVLRRQEEDDQPRIRARRNPGHAAENPLGHVPHLAEAVPLQPDEGHLEQP